MKALNADFVAPDSRSVPTWTRSVLAVIGAALIMAAASSIITMSDTPSHRAGYDAVISKGGNWIRDEVDAAGGTALRACDRLQESVAVGEYAEFVDGCSAGIDAVFGRHVPVLTDRR